MMLPQAFKLWQVRHLHLKKSFSFWRLWTQFNTVTSFIRLDKAISKNIYKEARSKVEIIPITQLKYSEKYNYHLEWKEIYRISFRVTADSRSREFQFKALNRYLRRISFSTKSALYLCFYVYFAKEKANLLNT